jgi:transcriptional regulator with XRE-family HTH domain
VEAKALVLERKIIGVLIRAAREKAHCTVKQLAMHLGVTLPRLRQYETGGRDISLRELELTATFFGLPLAFFFKGDSPVEEEVPPPPSPEQVRIRRSLLAAKLKQARLAAKKKKGDCAQAVGRVTAVYGKYERGLADIPVMELARLAQFLGVDLDYFIERPPSRAQAGGGPDLEGWARIPEDLRSFILDPTSYPYLRMAAKFKDLPTEKLKELGEILLVVR